MMLRRRGVLAGAIAVAAAPAFAQDAAAAAPIQALNQAILAAMRAGSSGVPFAQRFAAFLPAVDRAFDLPAVLAASVGPRLASLPPDQQAQLLDVFRKFTAASYVANFNSFGGERIEMVPGQRAVGQDVVVGTQIAPARGEATPIDYVMRRGAQGWRAIDVLLNGNISQNAVKRSDFRSLVTASSAQPLIDSLRRKVSELSGGAVT